MRRIVLSALACAVVLFGAASAAYLYSQPKSAHAAPVASTAIEVLVVHGFNRDGQIDCSQTWGALESYLSNGNRLPQASFHPVMFYTPNSNTNPVTLGDVNCDSNYLLEKYPGPQLSNDNDVYACDDGRVASAYGLGYEPQFDGSTSEDIQHLACELAWLIWDNFTSQGKPVLVVAHSMGGLIVRDALYLTSKKPFDPADPTFVPFPDHLNVPAAVTLASPHMGVSGLEGNWAEWDCNCAQPDQMTSSSSNTWLNDLIAHGANPQAAGGTAWLTMAMAQSQRFIPPGQLGCSVTEGNDNPALADPVGELMSGSYQIAYYTPCYSHGGYLIDTSDGLGGTAQVCSGCGSLPASWYFFHSLRTTYMFLLAHIPGDGSTNAYGGNGSMYWSSSTSTHAVQGAIYSDYQSQGGPPNMGLPISDEHPISNGRVSYFAGTACGSNSGSGIYWTASTNAHTVRGCIYQKYRTLNEANGLLGFPKYDEQPITNSSGTVIGHVSYFAGTNCGSASGSAIYDGAGDNDVYGCIYQHYISSAIGGPTGFLGLPKSDEQEVYSSSGAGIGRYNAFQGSYCGSSQYGKIWFSGGTGARETHGCIGQKYEDLGGPASFLGFPTSDEYSIAGGRANDFAGGTCGNAGGGHIYKLPTTNAQEVHGCIATYYLNSQGGPGGWLGFPTSDEFGVYDSTGTQEIGRESQFQNGYIYFDFSTGQATAYHYCGLHCS